MSSSSWSTPRTGGRCVKVATSIDTTRLIITRSGARPTVMTFVLDPATQREGSVAVGSPVEVRYRTEGNTMIATAITTPESKQPASARKAPSVK